MLQIEAIGNLGADAEKRDINGRKCITFDVAHNVKYKDQTGYVTEHTVWVSCIKYGESNVLAFLKRGTQVYVRGNLSSRVYQSNDGTWKAGISCLVNELQLLGGGPKTEQATTVPAVDADAPISPIQKMNMEATQPMEEVLPPTTEELPF